MREWQPIQAAPKDVVLLLYCPDPDVKYKIQTGMWKSEIHEWWERTNETTKKLMREESGYWDCEGLPTHWMPLPDPPQGA